MDKFELSFQEHFAKKIIQLQSGYWMHTEGNKERFFYLGKNTPIQEFKIRFPNEYKRLMDEWFDEVHPY